MVTLDQAGLARGWTRIVAPPASLEPFIELFWTQVASPVSAGRQAGWRIVPDAAPHLIVTRLRTLAGETSPSVTRTHLVGARSRYVDGNITRRAWTVGVRFRPGLLPLLTGLPAPDFADRSVSVADALRGTGTRLSDDLGAAATEDQALDLILAFLLRELRGVPSPDRRVVALERMAREGGRRGPESSPGVRSMADRIGVAERTLRKRCLDDIGLSPVLVVRVARVQRALGLALAGGALARDPHAGWARIAARSGYYDQSHLIRDFGRLLGETPATYIARGRID
jgi:AraC-like DNA-binding protein